ncbi:MAG: DeoR family transcriptional regulator [Lachnospirales bacterium]
MLGIIISAYREFEQRTHILDNKKIKKPDRVAETIKNTLGKMTKAEIMEKCLDVSEATVRRALQDLVEKNDVIKIGGGRYTSYVWNGEK